MRSNVEHELVLHELELELLEYNKFELRSYIDIQNVVTSLSNSGPKS
jgi:hypothetical protein